MYSGKEKQLKFLPAGSANSQRYFAGKGKIEGKAHKLRKFFRGNALFLHSLENIHIH